MQTSVLRYPKADRFIRIHDSLIQACDRNVCAAALITFFEGWHNYKLEQKPYTALYNTMATDAGLAAIIDTSGWQYHTMEQLEIGVMIYREDSIRKALDLLEAKEFVDTDVPEHLVALHKTGRTRWYLLRADNINEWFDQYQAQRKQPKLLRPIKPARDKKELAPVTKNALEVFDYWRLRLNHTRSVPDPKRLVLIADRLREGRTVVDLCIAVEGNALSAWHQGENDRKTPYDYIELIFRDATHTEKFMRMADGKITPAEIQSRLDDKRLIQSLAPGAARRGPEFTKQRIESVITAALPLLLTDEPLGENLRPLRVLVDGKLEIFNLVQPKLIDRIEASEGMYSTAHAARLEALIQALSNS